MHAIRTGFLLLATVIAAYGQLDSDTVTITASRSASMMPDQIQVGVNVSAPVNLTLDDILAALRGTGISATNFSSVYARPVFSSVGLTSLTEWGFMLTTPLSNLKNVLAPLARFDSPSNLRLDFYVQTMPPSSVPCSWPALLEDARSQAISLATSAGLKAGPIVSLSDANQSPLTFARTGVFSPGFSTGTLSGILTLARFPSFPVVTAPLPAPACSLTVQFKLLR